MLKLSLTIFIGGLIISLIAKILMKRRMRRALGRAVKDHELVSLNSWMKVRENEERGKVSPP